MSKIKVNLFTSFGDALAYTLRAKGLTNKEFSKKLGINSSQISHWLSNRNKPYQKTIENLSNILGVSIAEVNGSWQVSELKNDELESTNLEQEIEAKIIEKYEKYANQVALTGSSDADLDLLVSYALKEAEALQASLLSLKLAIQKRLNK